MSPQKKDGAGKWLAEHPVVVIISLIASCLAIFTFFTNIQSIQGLIPEDKTALPQPSQTPDLTSLYTFFPRPTIGLTKTYNFSYAFSEYNQDTNVSAQKTENGSYSEKVSIVNEAFIDKNITIVGIEVTDKNYLSLCHNNFYWYVYDSQRLYVICSKDYVFFAASEIASNKEPSLVINSMLNPKPLNISPEYLIPFDIGKKWESELRATVENKVTKTVPFGTFYDCFQISFFAVNYNELRYLCPNVGLVAIEIIDHYDYYSAELVNIK